MNKLTTITDRAMDLVTQASSSLKHVGPSASKLLQTGAALGAVKTGGRVAVKLVRRNPVVAVAAALGVGVLAYAAHRKRKRDQAEAWSLLSCLACHLDLAVLVTASWSLVPCSGSRTCTSPPAARRAGRRPRW